MFAAHLVPLFADVYGVTPDALRASLERRVDDCAARLAAHLTPAARLQALVALLADVVPLRRWVDLYAAPGVMALALPPPDAPTAAKMAAALMWCAAVADADDRAPPKIAERERRLAHRVTHILSDAARYPPLAAAATDTDADLAAAVGRASNNKASFLKDALAQKGRRGAVRGCLPWWVRRAMSRAHDKERHAWLAHTDSH